MDLYLVLIGFDAVVIVLVLLLAHLAARVAEVKNPNHSRKEASAFAADHKALVLLRSARSE